MLAAGLFATAGGVVLVAVNGLELGTMRRMGPGYLPTAVAVLILGLAAALAARAALAGRAAAEPVVWHPAPIAAILAALGAFALLIDPIGLVGATMALILAARFAERPLRPWETLALMAAGAAFSALIFVELLQLPIALWPA
jgi:hypothetical protein